MLIVACAFVYAGAFDLRRYADAVPTILQLAADALPPDFSRWPNWGRPLLETLSMSIAGTVLGAAAALPLGALSARNVVHRAWFREPVRLFLNVLRSIPGLIWGVIFVAAVASAPCLASLHLPPTPPGRSANSSPRSWNMPIPRRAMPCAATVFPASGVALFGAAANPTPARGCSRLSLGA